MTVRARGTDSSGRPIYASDYMWAWWLRVCAALGFTPTIVQGAWMSKVPGGGADASAGYHDRGGCFDLRTWDRSQGDVERMVRTLRTYGAGGWVRDARHGGMDPHLHFVLGSDHDLASGAASQWRAYIAGRDGLSSNGPDYHWRPDPLVLKPPEETDMFEKDDSDRLERVETKLDRLAAAEQRRNAADIDRIRRVVKKIVGVEASTERIEKAIAEVVDE